MPLTNQFQFKSETTIKQTNTCYQMTYMLTVIYVVVVVSSDRQKKYIGLHQYGIGLSCTPKIPLF